jgi:Flp pilus assembly protein TadD
MPPDKLPQWQTIAGFAFGCVFAVVILVVALLVSQPSEFQIFVFRVILSLTAAGIGAVIPGLFLINVGSLIRAGGALVFFVVVFKFNPPALATGFTPFADAIQRAEASLAANQYTAATAFFQKATQARPTDWRPYNGLGRVEFKRGNYTVSLSYLNKAFELEGKHDGQLLYGVAIVQDALGSNREALDSLAAAAKLIPDNNPLALDIIYDTGINNLVLWLNARSPTETAQYHEAEVSFKSFLERGGIPSHWAHYHLACLKAVRSEDKSIGNVRSANLQAEANILLDNAIAELAGYNSEKANVQREMMVKIVRTPDKWTRRAGEPVACPTLSRLASRSGKLKKLVSLLNQS